MIGYRKRFTDTREPGSLPSQMNPLDRTLASDAPKATLLVRLMSGAVFLLEGLQKFLQPALRGPGRFEKMGFHIPSSLGAGPWSLDRRIARRRAS